MVANGGKPITEERLLPMIVGAVFLPIELFWFAWTSSPHVHWAPQVLAGIPIGVAVELILLQGMSYIIDVYLMYPSSALAGNTLVRSLAGGRLPDVRGSDLSQPRSGLGDESAGFPSACFPTLSRAVLRIREEDSGVE